MLEMARLLCCIQLLHRMHFVSTVSDPMFSVSLEDVAY